MRRWTGLVLALLLAAAAALVASDAPPPGRVTFSGVITPVDVGRPYEVTVTVESPTARNCVTDVTVAGEFTREGDRDPLPVRGVCERPDGSLFSVRFVPGKTGEYEWRVTYRQGTFERVGTGSITVVPRKADKGVDGS
jgi:uncharacterized protein (DUF58 family)